MCYHCTCPLFFISGTRVLEQHFDHQGRLYIANLPRAHPPSYAGYAGEIEWRGSSSEETSSLVVLAWFLAFILIMSAPLYHPAAAASLNKAG